MDIRYNRFKNLFIARLFTMAALMHDIIHYRFLKFVYWTHALDNAELRHQGSFPLAANPIATCKCLHLIEISKFTRRDEKTRCELAS